MTNADEIARETAEYYHERAWVYDLTAGYEDAESELERAPIKARFQELLAGRAVLEIACGTGYWTAVIGQAAQSVLATDLHASVLSQAEEKCRHLQNVAFQAADAYTLDGVRGGFTAAFAHWWWSHIPRERIPTFLAALRGKLSPGALVVLVDSLPYGGHARRQDAAGNTLEERSLPDGRRFEIVKNFPTEADVRNDLAGFGENIQYVARPDEVTWTVTCNMLRR